LGELKLSTNGGLIKEANQQNGIFVKISPAIKSIKTTFKLK